jgi:hypothetical protein
MRIATCLVAALALCACAAHFKEPAPHDGSRDSVTLDAIRNLGADGDWLVVRGYHLSDDLVATLTNKPFSHAAVLDLANDRVVEAESKGVHFTPLAEFVAKSHRVLLVRPVWSNEASRKVAIQKARDVAGRPYDFLGLVGIDTPDRYYCSGLAVEVYRPFIREADLVPHPVEPGQLHYWGRILYDSGPI